MIKGVRCCVFLILKGNKIKLLKCFKGLNNVMCGKVFFFNVVRYIIVLLLKCWFSFCIGMVSSCCM